MSLMEKIKGMDQRFSWSFFGFLMAIVFGLVSLYLGFVKVDRPDLNYVITGDSSVLDIKEKVGRLDVLYEGESLNKKGEDLRIITFDVVNQGNSPLLPNYYDPNSPIGFKITDGVIADTPVLVSAANSYIKEKLVMTKVGDSEITFSNIIIEAGESFSIKILVLHDADKSPGVVPVGKVAGVSTIDLISNYSAIESKSIYEAAFGGGLAVIFFRLIVYGVVFCSILVWLFFIMFKIEKYTDERKRRRLVNVFKDYDGEKISIKDDYLFNSYIKYGAEEVARINQALSEKDFRRLLFDSVTGEKINKTEYYSHEGRDVLLMLVSEHVVVCKGDDCFVDVERVEIARGFFEYLKRKKELHDYHEYYIARDYIKGFEFDSGGDESKLE